MSKPELKVKPIENGTVIDHITANKALQVLKILGLPEAGTNVTIAMNVPSRLGLKDIVKIEDSLIRFSSLLLMLQSTLSRILKSYTRVR